MVRNFLNFFKAKRDKNRDHVAKTNEYHRLEYGDNRLLLDDPFSFARYQLGGNKHSHDVNAQVADSCAIEGSLNRICIRGTVYCYMRGWENKLSLCGLLTTDALDIGGSNNTVIIDGDVEEGATLYMQGTYNAVYVQGTIADGANIRIGGVGNRIIAKEHTYTILEGGQFQKQLRPKM